MATKGESLQLREIAPSDLADVAQLILRLSGSNTPLPHAVERLSWILLENPARDPGDPLGWQLRTPSGEIVGCMCCAPQKFCFGQKIFTLLMANSFYVDDRYRGGGTSIFLKYLQLARRYPLFVSSANPIVAEMWRKLGGYALGNSDHEVIGIVQWQPVLAETIYRKTTSDRLSRLASVLAARFFATPRWLSRDQEEGQLTALRTPDEAAGVCAEFQTDRITNCRDAAFLKWRYFSPLTPTARLFAFHTAANNKKFMVAVQLQKRGYKQHVNALQILDIWGETEPDSYLAIAAALARAHPEQIDMLVFRCLNRAQQQALVAHGFKMRPFAAPIAWCIDKYGLLPSKTLYFVPADGDMFL